MCDLNDSEAEGLLQGHVCEDAMGGKGQAVDVRDVLLGVPLGVGHTAVQVMVVYKLQDLGEHLGAATCHAVYQLSVPLHTDRVKDLRRAQDRGRQGCAALRRVAKGSARWVLQGESARWFCKGFCQQDYKDEGLQHFLSLSCTPHS